MGLSVRQLLYAMFRVAQEQIRRRQFIAGGGFDKRFGYQDVQNGKDPPGPQARDNPAAHQLEHLAEKLDFPDTAGPGLYVVFKAFTSNLQGNFLFHLPE